MTVLWKKNMFWKSWISTNWPYPKVGGGGGGSGSRSFDLTYWPHTQGREGHYSTKNKQEQVRIQGGGTIQAPLENHKLYGFL